MATAMAMAGRGDVWRGVRILASPARVLALVATILLALVALALAAPALAQEDAAEPVEAPAPAIAVEDDAGTDAAIRRRILALFGEIDGLDRVRVGVDAGVVTLTGRVLEPDAATEAEELAGRVANVAAVNNEIEQETDVALRLGPVLERAEARAYAVLTFLPLLLVALVAFALIAALGWLLTRGHWPWERIAPNAFLASLMRQVARIAVLAIALVAALDILGATALIGTVLGAAGIVGLAVGFAVRDTVENYIASILLSLRQPFRPNDLVLIEGIEGRVTALTSRATVLVTLESNHVRIPNAVVFKATITNYSRIPERRFDFRIGVETDDLRHAVDLGLETIRALPFVLDDPRPLGWIEEVGDSAYILFFAGWVNQEMTSFPKARSEAIRTVALAFEAAEIGIPEPIYRLRFDNAPALASALGTGAELRVTDPDEPGRSPSAADVSPGDVSPEPEARDTVADERARAHDLLSHDAPTEQEG